MQLIDFEKARKDVLNILRGKVTTVTAVLVSTAMKASTVDAVKVVRCKNCKHYGYDPYDNGDKCCVLWGEWIFPEDDDFCSRGERKDNA